MSLGCWSPAPCLMSWWGKRDAAGSAAGSRLPSCTGELYSSPEYASLESLFTNREAKPINPARRETASRC